MVEPLPDKTLRDMLEVGLNGHWVRADLAAATASIAAVQLRPTENSQLTNLRGCLSNFATHPMVSALVEPGYFFDAITRRIQPAKSRIDKPHAHC